MKWCYELEQALGRTLSESEQKLLEHLSPRGVAKINFDIGQGTSLETTFADLAEVYRLSQKRKDALQAALPQSAATIVQRMARPPTADEMFLLSEVSQEAVLSQISEELLKGVLLEDALEDLAHTYLQRRVLHDARRLATAVRGTVSLSRLA
eukprot:RCo033610